MDAPSREFCPECAQRAWQPASLSGEGTIASYTVIRVAPRGYAGEVPYAIAAVQLKEGVSLLGRVVDIPFERREMGNARQLFEVAGEAHHIFRASCAASPV